jgi:hypothetical protein
MQLVSPAEIGARIAAIRPATWEQVQAKIKRLKIKPQKNIEQLISEKELHNIIA